MVQCLVGLGSNLGDSRTILDQAVARLDTTFHVHAVSKWYSYPSVGPAADGTSDQPDFLNGVALLDSEYSPQETANELHELERSAGRNRLVRWSSRTLDADLLTYGDLLVETPTLQIPHPRMMSRRFVLEPANEVAANIVHPTIGWTIRKLFQHLCDAKPYFATIGTDVDRATTISQKLANELNGVFHFVKRVQTGSIPERNVQSVEEKLTTFAAEVRSGKPGPWFSNFWVGEYAQDDFANFDPVWNPKLVLVTDPVTSEFAVALANNLERYGKALRVPTIHLSLDENEAWQDALGAVQGMS